MEYKIDSDEQLSMAVVRAMSAIDGRPPAELPPLEESLDTDALNAVFAARSDGSAATTSQLSFIYNDYRITVRNGKYLNFAEKTAEPQSRPDFDQSTH